MQQCKYHISRFILTIVALQILNMSVYANDVSPYYFKVNNNISANNEVDCFAEYVGEIMLGYTNSFPEHKNHNTKDAMFMKHISFKLIQHNFSLPVLLNAETVSEKKTDYIQTYQYLFYQEINPPPPKHTA